jgi:hypothetical protein
MERTSSFRRAMSFLLCFAAVLAVPFAVGAQDHPWTTVGSAGTVDYQDLSEFITSFSRIEVKSTAAIPATVTVRYNVVEEPGLFDPCIKFAIRYLDNGQDAQVSATLYELSLATGINSPMLTFNSNSFGASGLYQLQAVGTCDKHFNFVENAYFVQVQLKKTGAKGKAGLQAIKIYTQ